MLYNGHLVIADTFLRNRPNHGQTLIEKPLYSGPPVTASVEHHDSIDISDSTAYSYCT